MDYAEHLIKIKELTRDIERKYNERDWLNVLCQATELSIKAREMKSQLHNQIGKDLIV